MFPLLFDFLYQKNQLHNRIFNLVTAELETQASLCMCIVGWMLSPCITPLVSHTHTLQRRRRLLRGIILTKCRSLYHMHPLLPQQTTAHSIFQPECTSGAIQSIFFFHLLLRLCELLVVQLCCIHHSSVLVLARSVDDPPSCSSLSRMHHFLLQHHYSHTHTFPRRNFPSSRSGAAAISFHMRHTKLALEKQ